MKIFGRIFDAAVHTLLRIACKIDDEEIRTVPDRGPMILIFNHINFLEAPLFYLRFKPRPLYAIMKVELSQVPLIGGIAKRWGGIPLERGAPPSAAFRKAAELLKEEALIAIAPEGTRSRSGRLQQGNPGVVTMALQNDVPIMAVVQYGSQNLGRNLKRLKRTDIHLRVSRPFKFVIPEKLNKESRAELTAQMMGQIARLLPEELRGVYADVEAIGDDRLRFDP